MDSDAISNAEPAAVWLSEAANSEASATASGSGGAADDTVTSAASSTTRDAAGDSATSVIVDNIARLKKEQAEIRAQRKRITQELKNAEKKRSRLKKKAKLLSDKDLLDVLHLRSVEKGDKQTTGAEGGNHTSADSAPSGDEKRQKV